MLKVFDVGDLLVHVGVEALNQGDDDDDRRDADDHAEERQRRAQLVRPDGGERELQCLDQFHGELVRENKILVAAAREGKRRKNWLAAKFRRECKRKGRSPQRRRGFAEVAQRKHFYSA